MKLGLLQLEIKIPGAGSLKDKRRVVRSLKDRLHHDHLVSVAEVGAKETWNLAILGVALVSNDGAYVHSVLETIVRKVQSHPEAQLEDYSLDVVDTDQLLSGGAGDEALWTQAERREERPETGPGGAP